MFSAADLVTTAKLRYGETILRERMRGATTTALADTQLKLIADSVISRIHDAVATTIGWPLPGAWPAGSVDAAGTSIAGQLYADVWPANLLQNALDLFNWRTVAGLEQASENQRRVGKMAEDFFDGLETGANSLGLASLSEPGLGEPMAARNRDGTSNVTGVYDRENLLDDLRGPAWDGWW